MLRVEKIHPNETSLLAVEPLENAVHGVGLAGVAAGLPLRVAEEGGVIVCCISEGLAASLR